MCDTRLPRLAGETFMEVSSSPRRVDVEELAELFRKPGAGGASARSPWRRSRRGTAFAAGSWSAKPTSGERGLTDERLRLLEGLSYRAAMALQKARLARPPRAEPPRRERAARCSRARLRAPENDDVEERIVRLAAEMLEAREVSLWLQAAPGAEFVAVAVWDDDEEHRALVLAASFAAAVAQAVLGAARAVRAPPRRSTPRFPAPRSSAAGAASPLHRSRSTRVGWASWSPAPPAGETFGELQLKMLAGLADQAKLAVSGSR